MLAFPFWSQYFKPFWFETQSGWLKMEDHTTLVLQSCVRIKRNCSLDYPIIYWKNIISCQVMYYIKISYVHRNCFFPTQIPSLWHVWWHLLCVLKLCTYLCFQLYHCIVVISWYVFLFHLTMIISSLIFKIFWP